MNLTDKHLIHFGDDERQDFHLSVTVARLAPAATVPMRSSTLIAAARCIEHYAREAAAQQAKIDSLMLEYCPQEMTDAQRSEWARHQRPVGSKAEEVGLRRGRKGP